MNHQYEQKSTSDKSFGNMAAITVNQLSDLSRECFSWLALILIQCLTVQANNYIFYRNSRIQYLKYYFLDSEIIGKYWNNFAI